MPGTVDGGKRASVTNRKKYGNDFYKRIGSIGGKKGTTGGFAANPELARIAGAKGGRNSRRTKKNCIYAECDKGAWKYGHCHDHFIEVYKEEHHE